MGHLLQQMGGLLIQAAWPMAIGIRNVEDSEMAHMSVSKSLNLRLELPTLCYPSVDNDDSCGVHSRP